MASPSPLCGYRIMIVEDNYLVAESLCDILTENGCKVIGPVSRLAQGLELAADAAIGGALLDINLAGEHCFPLANVLLDKGVPIAFLTGYGEGTVIPAALHGVPRLSKPFSASSIVSLIRKHFRSSAA